MASRGGLARLARLYGMVERLNAMQARAAASAVFEVDRAVERLAHESQKEMVAGREAMERGSRIEQIAAENRMKLDEARREALTRLKAERQLHYELAAETHRESRMESRQIDGMADRAREAADVESARREQHAADDRYLSRREWMRTLAVREAVTDDPEMWKG
jgi:hypothetical protein